MSSCINNLRERVKQELSEIEGSAYDFGHVDRVTRIASYLAKEEGADRELV